MASGIEALRVLDRSSLVAGDQHVCLIRPAMVSSVGTWSNPITPPIGLAYLASMVREAQIPVSTIDAIAENVDQYLEDDGYVFQGLTIEETIDRIPLETTVIGISCMFTQDWPWIRQLIKAVRERFPDRLIVAGGEHITALPEFSLTDCPELDLAVLGEGEETIVDIARCAGSWDELSQVRGIAYLRDGEVVRTCARARIRDVESVPMPAWDLFPVSVYLDSRNAHGVYRGRTMGILATRGCPYKCTFCSNPVMYGNLWMARDVDAVLDEIQHYVEEYGASNIDFYDLTMILKKSWILEFCRKIDERGLSFTWQLPTGTRSEVIDDNVALALYRTGCRNVTYAPESGSVDTLEKIKKRVHLDRLIDSIRSSLKAKINVKVNLVLGFPHETRKHVLQTIWFAWKLAVIGVHDAGIFLFSPYPGTALFDELLAEGRIEGLNDKYFRSLVAFMDPLAPSEYCRHVKGRELAFWRLFGMATFFGISYLVRPWRFVSLVRSLFTNESNTVLEQRLGAILRRRTQHAPPIKQAPVLSPTV